MKGLNVGADREFFEERAAIREFDGGQQRQEAEAAARIETERHRAECEARALVALPSDDERRGYLEGVEAHRGKEAAQALRIAAWQIMKGAANGKA